MPLRATIVRRGVISAATGLTSTSCTEGMWRVLGNCWKEVAAYAGPADHLDLPWPRIPPRKRWVMRRHASDGGPTDQREASGHHLPRGPNTTQSRGTMDAQRALAPNARWQIHGLINKTKKNILIGAGTPGARPPRRGA